MPTGKQNNDERFYKGYEGEPELVLSSGEKTLHIWDGYMEDIFGNPIQSAEGWHGLTRDYNEFVGPYADDCIESFIDLREYITDAKLYVNRKFDYEESADVINAIVEFLNDALVTNAEVTISLK